MGRPTALLTHGRPLKGLFLCLGILATRKRVYELLYAHLICDLILLQLLFDVFLYLLFIPSYCIHEISSYCHSAVFWCKDYVVLASPRGVLQTFYIFFLLRKNLLVFIVAVGRPQLHFTSRFFLYIIPCFSPAKLGVAFALKQRKRVFVMQKHRKKAMCRLRRHGHQNLPADRDGPWASPAQAAPPPLFPAGRPTVKFLCPPAPLFA